MKTYNKILVILLTLPFFTSCFYDAYIVGNNNYIEEEREIPEFEEITSSGNFRVFFSYAPTARVYVYGESNLLPFVETSVFSDQLKIRTSSGVNLNEHDPIEIYVEGPHLEKIKLTGSGSFSTEESLFENSLDIHVSGSGEVFTSFVGDEIKAAVSGSGYLEVDAECSECDLKVSGSGDIKAEGFSDYSEYSVSGSGTIQAYDLLAKECEAKISGSGKAYVNVIRYLDADISGSGCIFFIGHPTVNGHQSGSGRIIDANR